MTSQFHDYNRDLLLFRSSIDPCLFLLSRVQTRSADVLLFTRRTLSWGIQNEYERNDDVVSVRFDRTGKHIELILFTFRVSCQRHKCASTNPAKICKWKWLWYSNMLDTRTLQYQRKRDARPSCKQCSNQPFTTTTKQDVIHPIRLFCNHKRQGIWRYSCVKLFEIKQNVTPWLFPIDLPRKFEKIINLRCRSRSNCGRSHSNT